VLEGNEMVKTVDVLIVGGGISGLTLANLLIHANNNVKYRITLFESQAQCNQSKTSVGGGIGLWPPSQAVLRNIPNYEQLIAQVSQAMPPPSYRDSQGNLLAKASTEFHVNFPVQSLNRDDLIKFLLAGLKNRDDVTIVTSQKVNHYERENNKVIIKTADNQTYQGDLLIACDGIHSKIRNCLMSELALPPVHETDLGYTYFRANTQVPIDTNQKWWSQAIETWGSYQSKEYGNHEIRFGYVPLKPPTVFWFIAVKTQKNHPYLSPIESVELVNEKTKQFLVDLVRSWKPILTDSDEVVVDYAQLIHLTKDILRTDIAKIEGVETFPWTSKDKRVVLLGDAAHATAPNIAQGAGLCIEDAACLTSKLNRVDYLQGISEYEQERKARAESVQKVADLIASVGQSQNALVKSLRNGVMRMGTYLLPTLQQGLFEYAVSYSLGGSKKLRYWQAPPLSITNGQPASLFSRVFSDSHLLDKHVSQFKNASSGGRGYGVVSVERPSFFSKVIGKLVGLPQTMVEQPFYAEVTNLSANLQRWKRVFGYKTPQQKTYSTTQSSYCAFNRQMYLSEGVGGFFDKAFRFVYKINRQSDKSLKYESEGMTFFDFFKIPLPSFLLPKSEWVEKPTTKGWEFDGKISYPLIGTLMHYNGQFEIENMQALPKRRLIIAGGSGMIGKEVCLEFLQKGYDVYCLSRSLATRVNLEGVKVRALNDDWSDLIDKNTIIVNLSGSNPGAKRWTSFVKTEIAESRYQVIDTIIHNIDKAKEKPLKYLQASAVGIYGNAKDLLLTEQSEPVVDSESGTKFRVTVCQEIEKRAAQANCPVVNLRIGHVLSNEGGLLPYYRTSGFFNVSRFGSGKQFVPFVHVTDVAKAIEYIAKSDDMTNGAINITAPQPCRNSDMLKALRLTNWVPGLPLPESVLKFIIGESSVVLTDSERVQPKRLLDSGYQFDYCTIQESLNGLK
jgi:uncharacterized protein (TIGR01777 family)